MKYLLTLLLAVCCVSAFSQVYNGNDDYIPPSPNAFGAISRVNTSVSLYTGVVNIGVPITTLPGRKIQVPVSLSYAASGVKVQDVPGWVGTGWSLSTGGMITRIVRGLPDEDVNGFCGTNNIGEKAYQSLTPEYAKKVADKTWDSEPDLFYFEFQGKSGKFVLDETGAAVQLSASPLKITPGICNISGAVWTITDGDGVVYTFGQPETTYYTQAGSTTEKSHISTWYLTEIKTPGNTGNEDVVTFSYESLPDTEISYSYYTQEAKSLVYQASPYIPEDKRCVPGSPMKITNEQLVISIRQPYYLTRIGTAKGSIEFGREKQFGAIPSGQDRLNKITEKDSYGNVVKVFLLVYGNFDYASCNCLRAKLNEIYQVAGNSRMKLFTFQYNEEVSLPSRSSNQVDYWGYYNSNPSDTSKIPTVVDTDNPCSGSGTVYPGADRSTDTVRVKAGILTRVTNVTGQTTEYIYGANQYSDDGVTNKYAGGVRIRVINHILNGTIQQSTHYYYKKVGTDVSSGRIEQLPVFHFRSGSHTVFPEAGLYLTQDYLIVMSDAIKDLFNINGFHIGYSNVVESQSGRGSVRTTFTDLVSNPDELPTQYLYGSNDSYTNLGGEDYPYAPNVSKVFERGLILKQEFLNSENKLVQEKSFTYNLLDAPQLSSVQGIKVARRMVNNLLYTYYGVGIYKNTSKPYVLKSSAVTTYDQAYPGTIGASDNRKVTLQTDYSYIPIGAMSSANIPSDMQPRQVTQYLPTGEKLITQTKYITDYSYTPEAPASATDVRAFWLMSRDNMVAFPIESITYLEKVIGGTTSKYLLSGRLTRYKEYASAGGNKVHLSETRNFKTNGSTSFSTFTWSNTSGLVFSYNSTAYKLVYNAVDYDQFGNLVSFQKEDGIPVTIQYNNSGTDVSGVVKNPGQYQQQTSYQYKQLVGMSQQTDANGIATRYDYDEMNELKRVRDNDNNIVESYSSGVKGQLPQAAVMKLVITITGTMKTGSSIQFRLNDIAGGKYKWEFSDGFTTSSTAVSRSYTSPGTYKVKVTSFGNPATGETSAETQFVIQ